MVDLIQMLPLRSVALLVLVRFNVVPHFFSFVLDLSYEFINKENPWLETDSNWISWQFHWPLTKDRLPMAISTTRKLRLQLCRLPSRAFLLHSFSHSSAAPSIGFNKGRWDRIVKLFAINLDCQKRETAGLSKHTVLRALTNCNLIDPASHCLEEIDFCSAECKVNIPDRGGTPFEHHDIHRQAASAPFVCNNCGSVGLGLQRPESSMFLIYYQELKYHDRALLDVDCSAQGFLWMERFKGREFARRGFLRNRWFIRELLSLAISPSKTRGTVQLSTPSSTSKLVSDMDLLGNRKLVVSCNDIPRPDFDRRKRSRLGKLGCQQLNKIDKHSLEPPVKGNMRTLSPLHCTRQ